jgi:hypothetical protein
MRVGFVVKTKRLKLKPKFQIPKAKNQISNFKFQISGIKSSFHE